MIGWLGDYADAKTIEVNMGSNKGRWTRNTDIPTIRCPRCGSEKWEYVGDVQRCSECGQ